MIIITHDKDTMMQNEDMQTKDPALTKTRLDDADVNRTNNHTADGHTASDKAEATLYWINANLENGTNINQVRTRGVVASAHDGIISLSGLDDGEVVKFFAADGKYLGSAVAANGAASYAVSESLVIAKVGKDSIKIAMK